MTEATPTLTQKRCTRCKKLQPLTHFGIARKYSDGLNCWCKSCKQEAHFEASAKKKELARFGEQLHLALDIKKCAQCLSFKTLPNFHADRSKADGLYAYCRSCHSERRIADYAANKPKRIAASRRWEIANRERVLALRKKYYAANPDEARRRHKQWREDNRDAYRESDRRSSALRRAAKLGAAAQGVKFTAEQLSQRWQYFGNNCWICGIPATATDHVKPLAKGGAHMLCNLRPICRRCNSSKGARWPFNPEMICRVPA